MELLQRLIGFAHDILAIQKLDLCASSAVVCFVCLDISARERSDRFCTAVLVLDLVLFALALETKLGDEAIVATLHFQSVQKDKTAVSIFIPVSGLFFRSIQVAILSAFEAIFDLVARRPLQVEPIDGIGTTIHSLTIQIIRLVISNIRFASALFVALLEELKFSAA